jgi:hypothetical protein
LLLFFLLSACFFLPNTSSLELTVNLTALALNFRL